MESLIQFLVQRGRFRPSSRLFISPWLKNKYIQKRRRNFCSSTLLSYLHMCILQTRKMQTRNTEKHTLESNTLYDYIFPRYLLRLGLYEATNGIVTQH